MARSTRQTSRTGGARRRTGPRAGTQRADTTAAAATGKRRSAPGSKARSAAAGRNPPSAVVRQPQQLRSQQTLDRILDAAESMLESHRFEDITVADIVRKAKSSVGSFYQRFPNKESLLPALYDRYDKKLRDDFARAYKSFERLPPDLASRVRFVARFVVRRFRNQRWLLQALALHVRQRPETVSAEQRRARTEWHERWCEALLALRDQIEHPNPESAARMAIFMVGATCRDKILFGEAPHAASLKASDRLLVQELTHAMVAYLTTKPPASGGGAKKRSGIRTRRTTK